MFSLTPINLRNGLVYFEVKTAERIAAEYRSGDLEWTYTVEDYGNGWARVAITDEDGEFVGFAE